MKPPKTAINPRGKSAEKPAVITAARELTMATAKPTTLLAEVRELILASARRWRKASIQKVPLCWQIGQRIRTDILKEKRAEYGACAL